MEPDLIGQEKTADDLNPSRAIRPAMEPDLIGQEKCLQVSAVRQLVGDPAMEPDLIGQEKELADLLAGGE